MDNNDNVGWSCLAACDSGSYPRQVNKGDTEEAEGQVKSSTGPAQ